MADGPEDGPNLPQARSWGEGVREGRTPTLLCGVGGHPQGRKN